MKLRLLTATLFTAISISQAQETQIDIGGYVKYLLSYSNIPSLGSFTNHLLHSRLNTKWYASDALMVACEVRTRIYYGGIVEHTPNFMDLIENTHEFMNLDAKLWESHTSVGYAEIDRLFADWNKESLQITLGRQRFAFGTNLIWNPTDLFNPSSVLDFDYEERPAFDGARVQYYFGPLSRVEFVCKPGKTSFTSTTVAALTTNTGEYDFHLLAARKHRLWAIGGSWAGDISGGGFRGEAMISQKPKQISPGTFDFAETDGSMTSIAISGDYTFANSLYLHTEILYNSIGVTRDAGLFIQQSQLLGLFSPARWSIFDEISYNITPLIRGSVFAIFNPHDNSFVIVPSSNWSVSSNLDLMLILLAFSGDPLTEFSGYGEVGYLRLKYSF
jgi:hypothetical protein